MYRRMVFNVLIDNQDDHARNFSFIFDDDNRVSRLAPAYDFTPGKTYFGEHTTSVNSKEKDITDDMMKVAANNKIDISIAEEVINRCHNFLNKKS